MCSSCSGKLNPSIPGLLVEVDGRPFCKTCAKNAAAAPAGAAAEQGQKAVAPVWAAASAPDFFKPVAAADAEVEVEPVAEVATKPLTAVQVNSGAAPVPSSPPAPVAESPATASARDLASKFGTLNTTTSTPKATPAAAVAAPKESLAQAASSPKAVAAPRAHAATVSPESTPKPAVWTPPAPPPLPTPPALTKQQVPASGKSSALAKLGGGVPCGRCGKSVYAAEKVLGPGGDWHRACLTCANCKRTLAAGGWVASKTEAYCQACHTKLHGPKGVRGGADGGMMAA